MAATKAMDKQAVQDWNIYFSNFLESVSADQNESEDQRKKRVAKLESNPEEWKRYYFPKYCYAPAASFHKAATKRELDNPEWIEVRMWARELAKDVVEMMNTLYQTLTGVKRNILFISNSYDKAENLLEPFKINLERNERIINDYGVQQNPGSWSSGDFVTTQGVSFLAIGAGQSPRGSRNEEVRPDKIIISDIDTDEDVRNKDVIDKRWEWYEKAVYPTRSISKPFQVVWLGNKIANDCCVVRACAKADKVDIINIVDKKGESSWPEKNSKENIERIRSTMSTMAFEGEYMNNPISVGDVFKELTFSDIPPLNKFRFLVAYADPSPSNNTGERKNSTKALWLIGYLDNKFYVITGYLDRVTNDEFVDWFYFIRDYVKDRTQVYNYIENNTLQGPFFEQVFMPLFYTKGAERGHIGIIPDERKKPDKFSRIEGGLEMLVRTGRLVFNIKEENNPHMQRLKEQFKLFSATMKAPADGPDAIEGGVFICNNKILSVTGTGESLISGFGKSRNNRY